MKLKSANQRYKESGSSLPFKQWIEREKAKGIVIPQIGVTDVVDEMVNEMNQSTTESIKENLEPKKVLGLDKKILVISGLLIVGAIAFNYYRNNK